MGDHTFSTEQRAGYLRIADQVARELGSEIPGRINPATTEAQPGTSAFTL